MFDLAPTFVLKARGVTARISRFFYNFFFVISDGKNQEAWAKNLNSHDYELLCPDGGRAAVEDYAGCYLAHAPPHMVSFCLIFS